MKSSWSLNNSLYLFLMLLRRVYSTFNFWFISPLQTDLSQIGILNLVFEITDFSIFTSLVFTSDRGQGLVSHTLTVEVPTHETGTGLIFGNLGRQLIKVINTTITTFILTMHIEVLVLTACLLGMGSVWTQLEAFPTGFNFWFIWALFQMGEVLFRH